MSIWKINRDLNFLIIFLTLIPKMRLNIINILKYLKVGTKFCFFYEKFLSYSAFSIITKF